MPNTALILHASPRARGDSAALLDAFLEDFKGEAHILRPYTEEIRPCIDCRACWTSPGCALSDRMDEVYAGDYDCILLASPLYFEDLTPPLLGVLSRFQAYYANQRFLGLPSLQKPKLGAVFLTGGGQGSCARAVQSAGWMLKYANARLVSTVTSLNTDALPARLDAQALADARRCARLFNALKV